MTDRPSNIPWTQRIKTRLTLTMLLAIILPLFVFFIISTTTASRAFLDAVQRELELMSQYANATITDTINEIGIDIQPDAVDTDLLDLSDRELLLYMTFLKRQRPAVEELSLISLDGREVARVSRIEAFFSEDLRDFSQDGLLTRVQTGEMIVGEPALSPEGTILFYVAIPYINPEGKITGMLLAKVSLQQVFILVTAQLDVFENVYIVDAGGAVIAHSNYSLVISRTSLASEPPVDALLRAPEGVMTSIARYANPMGEEVLGLGVHSSFGWGIIAEIDADEALSQVVVTRKLFATIFLIATLIGLLASLIFGGRAARSIVSMRETAEALGAGDLQRRYNVKGQNELAALGSAINAMADRLETYYHELELNVETLNEKVDRRTTDLKQANIDLQQREKELRNTQTALVQTEKLASLGQLVAGVVHEVNNPLSFIINNVSVLQRDTERLAEVAFLYEKALTEDDETERHRLLAEADQLAAAIEIDYTRNSVKRMLERTADGLERIRKIVGDLRDFSHAGETEKSPTDLNANIETVLGMATYELKKKQITVDCDYGELPQVPCAAIKINQVLLNLIMNAVQAVPEGGHIWVKSWREKNWAAVSVRDNGHGIQPEIIGKIFDPFFTTRPPGKGTGLGLSVSYGIMKEHKGSIYASSLPEQGAEFTIRLPIDPEEVS